MTIREVWVAIGTGLLLCAALFFVVVVVGELWRRRDTPARLERQRQIDKQINEWARDMAEAEWNRRKPKLK